MVESRQSYCNENRVQFFCPPFIYTYMEHSTCVCLSVCVTVSVRVCVCREASTLLEDVKGLVEELEQEQQMSLINVELVDDELARVYANSHNAQVSLSLSLCVCLSLS